MEYILYGRGQSYRINRKGEFWVSDHFSPTWKIYGIATRWNSQPVLWAALKTKLTLEGKVITGYMHDIDHGTHRFWGGSWGGHLPKVTLRRCSRDREEFYRQRKKAQ
jgi:hypothetical protein